MAFVSTFLSYLLLTVVFAAVAGAAAFLGIKMRQKKNAEEKVIE